MIIIPVWLPVLPASVLAHACRQSGSRADRLASTELSLVISRDQAVIAPTIFVQIHRLQVSLVDRLPTFASFSTIDSRSEDLSFTARMSPSLFDQRPASTERSTIVISRDVAIIEPIICSHIHRLLYSWADQLLSSSAPSAIVIPSDQALTAPTILEHTRRLSASLFHQQLQASMALSTIVVSRDLTTIEPNIQEHIKRVPTPSADQLPASKAPSVLVPTHRLSASMVTQQLQASTALSTSVISSRHLFIMAPTIRAPVCRLPSPFADQLPASSMFATSIRDVAVRAPSFEYAIPESTALSTIVTSRDAIAQPRPSHLSQSFGVSDISKICLPSCIHLKVQLFLVSQLQPFQLPDVVEPLLLLFIFLRGPLVEGADGGFWRCQGGGVLPVANDAELPLPPPEPPPAQPLSRASSSVSMLY